MKKIKKKIYIEIDHGMDKGILTDVLPLIDSDSFLKEIQTMRNKYGLSYDFPAVNNKVVEAFVHQRYFDTKLKTNFEADIDRIRKLFNRPPHFNPVIESSVIYGFIGKNTYSKAYLEEQEITPTQNPEETPDLKYSIVIHAGTRLPDIKQVFEKFRKEARLNSKKIMAQTGYADLSLQEMLKTHGSIYDVRDWYIRRNRGESPLNITLSELNCSHKEYKELKKISKQDGYTEIKEKNDIRLTTITKKRDSIKELIKRYKKLL